MKKQYLLHALFIIGTSEMLSAELSEKVKVPTKVLKDAIEAEILDPAIAEAIMRIAPTCLKIHDKVFLIGETTRTHQYHGSDEADMPLTELFEMTTEMKNGQSCSLYVSDTSWFPLATVAESIEVYNYFKNNRD